MQEIYGFLSRTDAAIAAAQSRGNSYADESGEFDPALYEAANRAAGLRADVRRTIRKLSARKRAYALRARRPTRRNLAARIADLETLRSATRGRERDRYERALADARSEWSAGGSVGVRRRSSPAPYLLRQTTRRTTKRRARDPHPTRRSASDQEAP